MVDPSRPSTRASSSTLRETCRREAPRARRRASSRLRWATRIEKVLTMRYAPTTSATPAKISRKVWRNFTPLRIWLADSSAASSPVSARTWGGSSLSTASRNVAWDTPASAVTQMVENASLPSRNSFCGGRYVEDRQRRARQRRVVGVPRQADEPLGQHRLAGGGHDRDLVADEVAGSPAPSPRRAPPRAGRAARARRSG